MGKSSKKSATKVEAPAVVVPAPKSGKKGKRDAENEIEKVVSAKKQKIDEGVAQAIQKKKVETKTQKKKVETSSSEEESDVSSDSDVKKPAPKAAKNGKSKPSSSSESDDSDSDEEPAAKPSAPLKKSVPAKKAASSSSDDSSDEESDEEEAPKSKVAAKNGPTAAIKKKDVSTESSDESSDDSEDDDKTPAKVTAQKPAAAAKKGPSVPVKKADTSSSESEESSESEDEKTPAKVTAQKPAAAAKKGPSVPVKKADTSSSESEESSESEDEGTTKTVAPAAKSVKPSKKDEDSSDSDEDMDSDSSEEEPPKTEKVKPSQVSKQDSSESEEESSSDEEEEDEPAKTPKKKDTDVKMVDAESEKKAPKTPATPDVSTSKTLFAGNLNFRIEEHDLRNFFKDAGEVVDIRFASDPEGKFKGFGHVEFATAEAARKALELNGLDLLGRDIRLDLARERGERGAYTPTGRESNSYQKGPRSASKTIFVRGFDRSLGEDEIRSSLQEAFSSCGEITRVSIPKDYETGASKGMAYMDFSDATSFNKALEFNGHEFGDGYLQVEEAKPKGDFGTPRSNDRGGYSNNRGGGRFSSSSRGGRDGGGRGFRDGGRGRGRGNKPNLAAPGTGRHLYYSVFESKCLGYVVMLSVILNKFPSCTEWCREENHLRRRVD
ncbi:nucleolin 1-like isoform X4 [Malus domestica]|uniref:nucleolin 1-like isoform X4 n=1 Tax=Malus domestica TaxID=3750 RepID=UPI0010AAA2E1|nr:nucleolin 2-like isoform X4 [Malus domestica]